MNNSRDINKIKLDLQKVFSGALKIDIPTEEMENWVEGLYYTNLQKGEFYLRAGERCKKIAFLLKGHVRFYYVDLQGNEVTKYFTSKEEIILTTATLANISSPYYIEAIDECELLIGNYNEIMRDISKSAFGMEVFNKGLKQQILYKEQRECSFLTETATQRYKEFLKKFPAKHPYMKQKDIASYLGISPESLSRIKRKINLT